MLKFYQKTKNSNELDNKEEELHGEEKTEE